METIYDVLRLLLNASRSVISDATAAEAHKIIDNAEEVKADA